MLFFGPRTPVGHARTPPTRHNQRVSNTPHADSGDGPSPAARVLAAIRRDYHGLLRVGEVLHTVRFVLDPANADPVMVVAAHAVEQGDDAGGVTLHVPDDGPLAVHVLGHLEPLDPDRDAVCDRYLIYHGQPAGRENKPRWVRLRTDSVKQERTVVDRDELEMSNPLAAGEAAFCKAMNQDRERTSRICERATGTASEAPLVVGVDPMGIDVRARLGVLRVEFSSPCGSIEEVHAMLRSMEAGR